MRTKFVAICLAVMCFVSLSGQEASSLFGLGSSSAPALQDGVEVFMGTGFRYYDFDFGKKCSTIQCCLQVFVLRSLMIFCFLARTLDLDFRKTTGTIYPA